MTALLLLLAACERADTAPSEPPSDAMGTEQPIGPPAALRRDLRTCEGDATGVLGEIDYGVRVDPSGRVAMVKVLQGSVPASVLNCSLQRLRAWEFPPSREGAAFRFSMRFGEDAPSRPASATKANVAEHPPVLRNCYAKALRDAPDLRGSIQFHISISRTGQVTSARATPTSNLPASVTDCALAKVRAWTFPMDGATEGADVTFTVVLSGP